MTATLLIGAAGLWLLAAVLALGAWRRAGLVAASAVSGAGGLLALAGGIGLLLRTEPLHATLGGQQVVGTLS
ncbi:MAG: hypothetical protein ACRD0H_15125, partial [Actinomycetes bacterium]